MNALEIFLFGVLFFLIGAVYYGHCVLQDEVDKHKISIQDTLDVYIEQLQQNQIEYNRRIKNYIENINNILPDNLTISEIIPDEIWFSVLPSSKKLRKIIIRSIDDTIIHYNHIEYPDDEWNYDLVSNFNLIRKVESQQSPANA